MPWTMNDVASQKGKTILITGSNTGVGFATARHLAGKGASIIMACRNMEKGQQAMARLKSETPVAGVSLLQLDLASLASVRQCAETLNARQQRLDVLINNAAVMMAPFERTVDGFEMQFATHVLGHFALTALLLPLLDHMPQGRVVWVGSAAHLLGRIDFDDLNAEKGYRYKGFRAYAQSKLANVMLAYELQRRLQRAGSSTISLGAHPGGAKSDLVRHRLILKIIVSFYQTIEEGAMPSVRAAVDPAAQGGDYYGPGGFMNNVGPPVKHRSAQRSYDEAVAAQLWQTCEQLTGVRCLS